MPVILMQKSQVSWLDGTLNTRDVQSLASKVILEKHTVSRRVNSVQNEDSRLIEATTPLKDDQMMFFWLVYETWITYTWPKHSIKGIF